MPSVKHKYQVLMALDMAPKALFSKALDTEAH